MSIPARAEPSSQPSDSLRGMALLRDPLLNKGTAFTEAERDTLGLRGLLPAHVLSMDEQIARFMTNLRDLPNCPSSNALRQFATLLSGGSSSSARLN
jgi:malate dehydrogenase (oxaloacetate-decarboxylating)(NADP+)